jgi:hypothetical protein
LSFIEIKNKSYRVGIHVENRDAALVDLTKTAREKSGERELMKHLFPPHGKVWSYTESGKPVLRQSGLDLSFSHSENITVCQLSPSISCGIDIQHYREKILRVKDKFLNAAELLFSESMSEKEQIPLLTAMWSAKEVLYKMYGKGFIDYLNKFTIHPFRQSDSLIIATADFGYGPREFYLRLLFEESYVIVFHHGIATLDPDDIIHLPHF